MAQESKSYVKHTAGGALPDSSVMGRAEERIEADLPLLSDPIVQRWIALVGAAIVLGIGAGIFFLRRGKRH